MINITRRKLPPEGGGGLRLLLGLVLLSVCAGIEVNWPNLEDHFQAPLVQESFDDWWYHLFHPNEPVISNNGVPPPIQIDSQQPVRKEDPCDIFANNTNPCPSDDNCTISNMHCTKLKGPRISINSTGYNLHIKDSVLSCDLSNKDDVCGIIDITNVIKGFSKDQPPIITLTNTTLRFRIIQLTSTARIEIDKDSSLNASGTSLVDGYGHTNGSESAGGSFGGQGGNCDGGQVDSIYGRYDQIINLDKVSTYQYFTGSGGSIDRSQSVETRGGGAVVLISDSFDIQGVISAEGMPQDLAKYYVPEDKKPKVQASDVVPFSDGITEGTLVRNKQDEELPNSEGEQAVREQMVAGGSGGYILIQQKNETEQTRTNNFQQVISANGGLGANGGWGGSGGRVVIDVSFDFSNLITAYGGKNPGSVAQQLYCQVGAPGTIYYVDTNSVFINGGDPTDPTTQTTMKTGLGGLWYDKSQLRRPSKIVVSGQANMAPYNINDNTMSIIEADEIDIVNDAAISLPINYTALETLMINCSTLYIKETGRVQLSHQIGDFIVNCSNIKMESQGSIVITQVNNTCIQSNETIKMDSTTQMMLGPNLTMEAQILNLSRVLLNGHLSNNEKDIFVTTQGSFIGHQSLNLDPAGTIKADYANIFSTGPITIQGDMNPSNDSFYSCQTDTDTAAHRLPAFVKPGQGISEHGITYEELSANLQDFYNLSDPIEVQDLAGYLRQNFTTTIISLDYLHISSADSENFAQIFGPKIGIFGNIVDVAGAINATEFGCQSNQGIGAGQPVNGTCGGGGGSYASNGGIPAQLKALQKSKIKFCNDTSAKSYGDDDLSLAYVGSGGGSIEGSTTAGNGGGIIWVQSIDLTVNGYLLADGGNASNGTDSGGGSGGTIGISTYYIQGSGNMSVAGGSSNYENSKGGGAGSGGKLKVNRLSNDLSFFMANMDQNKISIQTEGGWSLSKNRPSGTQIFNGCPSGFQKAICEPCGFGLYSNDAFSTECSACNKIPDSAHFVVPQDNMPQTQPECDYQCLGSLTPKASNPDCLDDFSLFIQEIGGYLVFALIIVGTVGIVIAFIYFLAFKTKDKDLIQEKKRVAQNEQGHDTQQQKFLSNMKWTGGSQNQLDRLLIKKDLKFFDKDMYQHLSRIRLIGDNSPYHPWSLPVTPPGCLRQHVAFERYVTFAGKINEQLKWSRSERVKYFLLKICYPAFIPQFLKSHRHKYCRRLIHVLNKALSNSESLIWKSEEARMRNYFETKITFSKNLDLAVLDVLDSRKQALAYQGPQFPQTLLLSGEGLCHNPFYLDYESDPVVKSIGMRLNSLEVWHKFVLNLNSKLLPLQYLNFGSLFKDKLMNVLAFIKQHNKEIFEAQGFKLHLYLVEINELNRPSITKREESFSENYYKLDSTYIQKKKMAFSNFLKFWLTKQAFDERREFKLALVIVNTDSNKSIKSDRWGNHHHRRRLNSFNGERHQEQIYGARVDGYGHQQHYEDDMNLHEETGNDLPRAYDYGNEDGSDHSSPAHGRQSLHKPEQEHLDNVQWIVSVIREPHIDKNWLKPFKMTSDPDSSGSESRQRNACWTGVQSFFKALFMMVASSVKLITYRARTKNTNIKLTSVAFILLVVSQLVLTFIIYRLVIKFLDNDKAGLVFIFIFPLASILSPIMGIIAIARFKAEWYQLYSYMNGLSMLTNTLLFIISKIVQGSIKDSDFSLVVGYLLFATQFLISQLIPFQVAYFTNPHYDANRSLLIRYFMIHKPHQDSDEGNTIYPHSNQQYDGSDQDSVNSSDAAGDFVPYAEIDPQPFYPRTPGPMGTQRKQFALEPELESNLPQIYAQGNTPMGNPVMIPGEQMVSSGATGAQTQQTRSGSVVSQKVSGIKKRLLSLRKSKKQKKEKNLPADQRPRMSSQNLHMARYDSYVTSQTNRPVPPYFAPYEVDEDNSWALPPAHHQSQFFDPRLHMRNEQNQMLMDIHFSDQREQQPQHPDYIYSSSQPPANYNYVQMRRPPQRATSAAFALSNSNSNQYFGGEHRRTEPRRPSGHGFDESPDSDSD